MNARMGEQDADDASACWKAVLSEWSLSEQIVPITGAGISVNFNLPAWKPLTDRLCDVLQSFGDTETASIRSETDLLLKTFRATHRLRSKFRAVPQEVTSILRTELYRDFAVTRNGVLWLECIHKIVRNCGIYLTFNFDDLFELYARLMYSDRVVPVALQRVPRSREGNQIDVYHLHGQLPRSPTSAASESSLVFDLISYVEAYTHSIDQMSVTLLHVMTNCRCVFFGLSMVDPNLLRLVKMAHELRKDDSCWGIVFGTVSPEIQDILAKWGVATAIIPLGEPPQFGRIPEGVLAAMLNMDEANIEDLFSRFKRALISD